MADALKVLSYEGSLGIAQAAELQREWLELLQNGNSLIVNLSRIESLDLAIVQLVLAAKIRARTIGLSFQVANQISPAAVEAFQLAGLVPDGSTGGRDLDRAADRFIADQGAAP